MSDRKIRRDAREANQGLQLDAHPDLHSIQAWLEAKTGRPITIVELPAMRGDDLCGMYVSYKDFDVVVHAPPRSAWQRQQIILHEFSHMILNHQLTATSLELVRLPGFPETPLKVLGRTSFDDDDEATAEYLADLLTARIHARNQDPPDDQSGFKRSLDNGIRAGSNVVAAHLLQDSHGYR
ncbi:hypothetical protein [Arthrobacter polaris]|uniref:hypothetical protein n=1 Tax=Arthrobacter polaris TaxID=2813727 RepID=UPI001F38C208|nr:hypothetical protein [Arthrobacter polaris]UIK88976.1 hypothetical protein J0916_00185 [Arthrobacter polaris]